MKKNKILQFLLPLLITSLVSIAGLTSIIEFIDYNIYDAALHIKPMAPQKDKFLNITVSDTTLDELKQYPVRRSTLADGIMVLKELGAKTIILDTQLVDPSSPGVNTTQMNKMPTVIDTAGQNTLSYSRQLIQAIAWNQIDLSDETESLDDYLGELEFVYDEIFDNLKSETEKIALDFDEYIGKTFKFMNNVYVTNDFEEGKTFDDSHIEYLKKTQSIKNIEILKDPFEKRLGYNPTIKAIMENSIGSGFVENNIDSDGKTRTVHLLLNMDDHYYPQLSFKAYLDSVGNPKLIAKKGSLVLSGIKKEGKNPYDITIPLNADGSLTLLWGGKDFKETFEGEIDFIRPYDLGEAYKVIYRLIEVLISFETINRYTLSYKEVLNLYDQAEKIRDSGDETLIDDYIELRSLFLENAGIIFNGTDDSPSLDVQYESWVEELIATQDFEEGQIETLRSNAKEVKKLYENGRNSHFYLVEEKDRLIEKIKDSIIVFGYTATSTFDIGANPFDEMYFNMGIYTTLYNNLLHEKFITTHPKYISIIIAFILVFIAILTLRKREAKGAIILGTSTFLAVISIILGIFVFTGHYIYLIIPVLSYVLVFIQMVSEKLLTTSKDKAFIKSAFGQYLSEDVIKEIIADPSKLQLGGQRKEITAFFTDVKGFSTISEKLTPDELVHLLNEYLTAMSNIALENKGTIDKYEGDAIIGFFGAPAPLPDHATKAVTAAIRMKEMEAVLNKDFLERKVTPSPLLTRIGINSGPCVVGNMGTPKKMDYTMMGNDVNIAARLEGVNKQYGTWILASESTMNQAEDIFLARRLDRVRVVGINTPIRLYNPLAIRAEASKELTSMVENFEEGIDQFELRNWEAAKNAFQRAFDIDPEDATSQRYIKMAEKFMKEPPEESWDGVFNLTSK
jgi:adenylate cyclase